MRRATRRSAHAVLLALMGILLLASPVQASSRAPAPVTICDQNATWHRPSPEAMAQRIWRDARYVDPLSGTAGQNELAFYTHHFFAFTGTSAGVINRALDLTGLAVASPRLCRPGAQGIPTLENPIMVWIFGNTLRTASRDGGTLYLTVAPSTTLDEGYVIVEVPRARLLVITSPAGQNLTQLDLAHPVGDSATAIEPLPDRTIPPSFPRPTNGRAVLDGADSLHVETIGGEARATYARYLVLVPPGTTPLQVLQRYAAALRAVGFQVDPIAVDPEAEAYGFTFSASSTSGRYIDAGRILAPRLADPSSPGAIQISLFLGYADENGHLPSTGGVPQTAFPVGGALGLVLLSAGVATRRRERWIQRHCSTILHHRPGSG